MKLLSINHNYSTCRTEITLFGAKIKIFNKKLIKVPDYTVILNKVKEKYNKKQKIRVAFYVSENAKWNADELYRLLEQSEAFEPVVLVSLLSYVHEGNDITRNNLHENYSFFKNCGKNVLKAYDEEKKEYIPLENFDLDIIFYQQPWGIPDIHNIDRTKDFALSFNYHYGLSIFKSKLEDMPFYRKLFTYFVSNLEEETYLKKIGYTNTNIIGFPKLDVYRSLSRTSDFDRKVIIYAPHFSYQKNSILKIGTFSKTGEKILEFAKQHPEYNWVFKPHPNFKNQLSIDKNYGLDFVNKYYSEWANLGELHEQGNYFDLFIN